MKYYYLCLIALLPLVCYTHPVETESDKTIVVEDTDQDHAESENSQIAKRSGGGFDIVQSIKSSVLGGVGRASASFASASSSGSGGGGYKSGGEHANSVSFDPLSLKKSILGTIFQAVKAITGGVTAIKGQLLKGSGYALAAGGKLVAVSGDKVTDVGKAIVSSAQLGAPLSHSHPFIGKFGGLSGASSSSSGGGHPVSGPAGHSETITSYEIPSGHGSYGPPSKAPSYGSTQYLPAGGFGGGGHFTGSAAFEGSPSGWPSKYGIPLEGPPGYYGPLNPRQAHSAVEALKEIEHLLPLTKTKETIITPSSHYKPVIEQYPIPHDSSPSFRPYVQTVQHTNTITTAHGGTPLIFPEDENVIPYDSSFTKLFNSQPWDVYHSMAKKRKSTKGHHEQPGHYHSSNSLTPIIAALATNNKRNKNYGQSISLETSPSQKHPSFLRPPHASPPHFMPTIHPKIDYPYKQSKQHPNRGKTYEIYKSHGFQIRDPALFNRQLLY